MLELRGRGVWRRLQAGGVVHTLSNLILVKQVILHFNRILLMLHRT